MTILYIIIAVLLLGIIIMGHEMGHFYAARATGIPVRAFAVGFGPALVKWKSKKYDTEFFIRAIPLGGYCAFYGEDDADANEKLKDDPRYFNNAKAWKRFVTIIMGPVMNFVFAFVVCTAFYWIAGAPTGLSDESYIQIAAIELHTPAEEAGLQKNDVIVSINGVTGYEAALQVIADYKTGDAPLTIMVDRNGEEVTLTLTPFYDAEAERCRAGISVGEVRYYVYEPCNLGTAVTQSWDTCVYASGAILNAFKNIVTTGEGLEDTGSVLVMIDVMQKQMAAQNWNTVINFVVMISINLGIFNLFPIPGLDGGRAVFLIVEMIRRKPNNRKIEAYATMGGFVVLFGLMIVLFGKDILTLLGA